jgi:demethylmenaquinone methyltransferase/2-methoxy-6-polyprenyl-1,4-benzoquinol methylase
MSDKADRVRRMFGAIARRYDLNNRVHSFGRDQSWRRRAVALAEVRPGDDVLDAACGTGDLAEAFVDGGAASVTGVDFSPPMIELARRKAGRRPDREVVPSYTVADVTDLPFEDAAYDIVSIAFGLRNVAEPFRALAEFRRILRPGGRLVILEFSEPSNRALRVMNRLYCGKVMPLTATLLAGDRTGAYRYLPRSVSTFADRDKLVAMMAAAGMTDLRQHALTFGVCVVYVGRTPGSRP